MRIVTKTEAQDTLFRALGGPTSQNLHATDTLSSLIRLTASFCCPCQPADLAKTVISLLQPLTDIEELRDEIYECLDEVIAYGDIIELRPDQDAPRQLTLSVPSVVKVSPRRLLLVGVSPHGKDNLPSSLRARLTLRGCARVLDIDDIGTAMSSLVSAGFLLVTHDEWNRPPHQSTAADLISKYDRLMASERTVGSLGDLELLIPDTNVMYYRGRWQTAKSQSGAFVARRERRFGASSWCYVTLTSGTATGLVDLPMPDSRHRGCDEAWHLQQAIDHQRGEPQVFRVRTDSEGSSELFDLFSPIPEWAHRRWNAVGERVAPEHCLFSYRFDREIVQDESRFAETRMWLKRQ
jgi:hypothetical protein